MRYGVVVRRRGAHDGCESTSGDAVVNMPLVNRTVLLAYLAREGAAG